MERIKLPSELDIDSLNLADKWKEWKEAWELYRISSNLHEKDDATQIATIQSILGTKSRRVLKTLPNIPEDITQRTVGGILTAVETYCVPRKNTTYERYVFRTTTQEDRSFDIFVTDLRRRAEYCDFGAIKDSLIRDQIVTYEENPQLRQRAKYLRKCKDAVWNRWTKEYLRGLRERHTVKHKDSPCGVKKGDMCIIKDDNKDRNKWKLGIVEELFAGHDGVVRAVKLRGGKSYLERAVQQLHPLELSCYKSREVPKPPLNPEALAFKPKGDAATYEENPQLRQRAKYLRKCKDAVWNRWTKEYLRGLRERHTVKHKDSTCGVKKGDMCIIKDDNKDRNKWKLGIVEELFAGHDGVVRAVKLRGGKSYLERAVQQLHPLELSCYKSREVPKPPLNPEALAFKPKGDAAVAARQSPKHC
ncbi:hypothetical protein AWC38_SpisGene23147 [Stylophora pistillata]|uniref:DUF5641 domain-containing protein n=1 Tax=Stylophora pistillata TaxID=50429 RepID=A0A2B4R7M3_STYPI|nr:hypothetical protein AWC38_SpisGene23147 [Stylophora pistillata]